MVFFWLACFWLERLMLVYCFSIWWVSRSPWFSCCFLLRSYCCWSYCLFLMCLTSPNCFCFLLYLFKLPLKLEVTELLKFLERFEWSMVYLVL